MSPTPVSVVPPPQSTLRLHSTSNAVLLLLRTTQSTYASTKRAIIETCGRTINESLRSTTSSLSGLYDLFLGKSTAEATSLVQKLRLWLYLTLFMVLVPILCGFWNFKLGVSLSVVIWPLSLYISSSLFYELQYLQHTLQMMANSRILGEKSALLQSRTRAALQLIQEVELVSRGYRITTQLSPIARLERNAKNRRCQVIREATESALSAVHSVFIRLLKDTQLASYVTGSISDMGHTLPSDGDTSITNLRSLFQVIQLSLLQYAEHAVVNHLNITKISSDEWKMSGEPTLAALKILCSDLAILSVTITGAESQLSKALSYQDSWIHIASDESLLKSKFVPAIGTRASLLDALNALQSSLQTQSARISLCKDRLQQLDTSSELESTMDEMIQTFSKFQQEMEVQTPACASSVSHALNRLAREAHQQNGDENGTATSGATRSTQTHGEFELSFPATTQDIQENQNTSLNLNAKSEIAEGAAKERVYEAETCDEDEEEIKPSALSREERIAIARQAREEAQKKEEEVFARLNFVLELKDVLQQRSLPPHTE